MDRNYSASEHLHGAPPIMFIICLLLHDKMNVRPIGADSKFVSLWGKLANYTRYSNSECIGSTR